MITEDYVSFDTAKLLKEKGFDVPYYYCNRVYSDKGTLQGLECVRFKNVEYISAPTLQMSMKWLREAHHIFICILPYEVGPGVMDYTYVLYKIEETDFLFKDIGIQGRANTNNISYEETCEAAIKYCLENLI